MNTMVQQFDTTIPMLDNHCHLCFPEHIEQALENYQKLFQELSISRAGLLSCPVCDHAENNWDISENVKILYLKDRLQLPCYAYANFTHYGDDPESYAQFAMEMLDMGFDGFKSLDQHPKNRKQIGRGLNDPVYAEFFRILDEKGLPIVCHVGDPRNNWDLSTATQTAVDLGRVYGPDFLSLDELYVELEEVIEKYRSVKFIIAHFSFVSDDYDHACRLMEYPNVYLDLTPGSEMFVNFSKDIPLWREFFLKHSKRIVMGSDQYAKGQGAVRYRLARNFLEGTEPFTWDDKRVVPIQLPRQVLEDIYWNNAVTLAGTEPKPVNRKLAYAHCCRMWDEQRQMLSELGQQNLKVMLEYWRNASECV